jgi:prepilin-type N-terminal cleavage/methylation domain-containing protein
MRVKNFKKQRGFTLVEMLVSVGLFVVVLTITLGSILTIVDSNKKARSLMSVTNNLNFAVDSMVRSFKVGDVKGAGNSTGVTRCFSTFESDYTGSSDSFNRRWVEYCLKEDVSSGKGKLTKEIGAEDGTSFSIPVPLTSPDIDIDFLEFNLQGTDSGAQPILSILISGTVKVSEKISSNFSIQTSVSQRILNI